MLKCDIDEISFVFLPNFDGNLEDFGEFAFEISEKISELLQLDKVSKSVEKSERGFAGYTTVYSYDDWKVSIAFNERSPNMGIYCKFTGQGLKNYLMNLQVLVADFEVYDLVKSFFSITDYFDGVARVSKADLAIDFIDEGLTVSEINSALDSNSQIFNANGKQNLSKIAYVVEDREVQTMYIGSRKNKSLHALLRIYDKKVEQLQTKGVFYREALETQDWVRFEASYRKSYANQIGEDLIVCSTKEELTGLIFRRFTDRYRFGYAKDAFWDITKIMLALSDNNFDALHSDIRRKNDLNGTYDYLVGRSGLESFMFKISRIYGESAIDEFLNAVKEHYSTYTPNLDVIHFLNEHEDELKNEKKPWE